MIGLLHKKRTVDSTVTHCSSRQDGPPVGHGGLLLCLREGGREGRLPGPPRGTRGFLLLYITRGRSTRRQDGHDITWHLNCDTVHKCPPNRVCQ